MSILAQQQLQKKQAIQQTFNTVAKAYGLGSSRYFHLCGETMAELLPLTGSESVLDVACGTGAMALPLAKRLPQGAVTGVDLTPGMLEQARAAAAQQGVANLNLQVGDMTQLPFFPASFDHATCAFGLFFVDEMGATLRHIASKVRPGGRVLISGFCGKAFQPMANLFLDRLRTYGLEIPQRIGWQRMSEPEQLQQIFNEAGLQHLQIHRHTINYHIDLDGWWDIIWNAGFRGMVEQLGERLSEFKHSHYQELLPLCDEQGLPLTVEVNFSYGTVV